VSEQLPRMSPTGVCLDPAPANIQLDAEKLDITSPDSTPAITASEDRVVEHLSGTEDVEMGEPAIPNLQDKNVSCLIVRSRPGADLSNLDP